MSFPRTIVHLDADAFFAAVEQAADVKLRGKPVAVGGGARGIIASASYEARRWGVYTPMPAARARKLCPKLIVLPGDFERYEQFSHWMFGYCYDFTPDVEQTSIDEGYFDLTGHRRQAPVEIARTIRKAIGQRLKITVSEGIATNKLVSAIASKLHKPGAFQVVPPGEEAVFLQPLSSQWLPGIGPQTGARLCAAGLATIGQVAGTPLEMLELLLGASARCIRQFAHGIDERPLVPKRDPQKTFSRQETFAADITDEEYVEATLRHMADRLFARVREEGRSIRTLTVRVRYNDRDEDQVSESLREPTDLETDIYGRLRIMLRAAWRRRVSLRLVALKLGNVYDGRFRAELPLEVSVQRREAAGRLAGAIDALRRARGYATILRGHDLRLRLPPRAPTAHPAVPGEGSRGIQILSRPRPVAGYVPLRTHSHYSFLDSVLSPAAIVQLARQHGLPAVALTDSGNLHGAVEFVQAAKQQGVKPVLGVELNVRGQPLLLYVASARGYHQLCQLLSHPAAAPPGHGEASVVSQPRRALRCEELAGRTEGLIAVGSDPALAELFPQRFYQLATGGQRAGKFPGVVGPAIRYAMPGDRQRYDIVQSIRTRTLLRQPHPEKDLAGQFHFRTPEEMARAAYEHPDWLQHTHEIAARCQFELPFGQPQFPAYVPPDGTSPGEFLRQLVWRGLRERYGARADRHRSQAWEELDIINAIGYAEYFLVTWDLLQACRQRGISWITRGSAADSLVCYGLGISGVCPVRFNLYFRRFLNRERMARHKLPDIDIDFPHDQKDAVINLIFAKYGPAHCAVVGGFATFQARSAFAEVAKVLGVAEHMVRRFTEHFPWSFRGCWKSDVETPGGGMRLIDKLEASPVNRFLPLRDEPYRTALLMAGGLDGVPRHPKMHPCGLVLSRQPLHELMPTFMAQKGYATTHFDMDAVEAVGLVKMDILAQGGLAVMRDVQTLLAPRGLVVDLEACVARRQSDGCVRWGDPRAAEPWQDPRVWAMIAAGDARAVHHIESPAMIGLCRRCNVRDIDGLVAIVSVIRPGAANEGKKQSFARRYQGLEPITCPHPDLASCLRSTFGLVVYEEHILQICEIFAGLPPGRGDVLRRALNKQDPAVIAGFQTEFTAAARQRGHTPETIAEVWRLITGFAGYAFCKAHSAAYGVEAYQSAWLKHYFPAEFMAAVLTNGKGFYDPLVYVLECHRLGLKFLPPSINEPGPMFAVHGRAIRVPLVRAKGLTDRTRQRLLAERARRAFASLADFCHRVQPLPEELETMIRAGGFDEFGQPRTRQFWEAQHWRRICSRSDVSDQEWLLPPPGLAPFPAMPLREPTRRERLESENELFGYPVSGHPLERFADIAWETYCPVAQLRQHPGATVVACGLVIEQRTYHQVTGEPMKFLTLADWTGMVETELFAPAYRRHGLATVRYPVLEVTAAVEPFENGRGFSLRVLHAGPPRRRPDRGAARR